MLDILLAHIYVTENIKVNIKYQNKAKVNNNNACKADLLWKFFGHVRLSFTNISMYVSEKWWCHRM